MSTLAIKYRPKSFDDVVGQSQAVGVLRGAIINAQTRNKSPAGMYFLYGPRGTGKTTLARAFARALNCANFKQPGACSTARLCGSCQSHEDDRPVDIIEMNGAEARGIDDVRNLIEQSRQYAQTNFRTFIIDEVHQFTPAAQEAILKVLEEPRGAIWILCTTNPEKVRDTIRSRAIKVGLDLISREDLGTLIHRVAAAENLQVPDAIVTAIVESAEGHAREALMALDRYLSLVSSGQTAEIEKVAAQITSMAPAVMALTYVSAAMGGNYERMFVSSMQAENKTRLLTDILEVVRGLMLKATGSDMLLQRHVHARKLATAKVGAEHMPLLAALYDVHLTALNDAKSYLVSEQDIVDGAIARTILAIKAHKP